jgi:hypothetical protein
MSLIERSFRHLAARYTNLTGRMNALHLVVHSFFVILGCIAVWWGIMQLRVYWRDYSIERIGSRILAGDPYKVETLAQQIPTIDRIKQSAYCRPAALRSTAIIQLRMLEVAASPDDYQYFAERQRSTNLIRRSLSCLPADPFLWLALYSVEVTETGIKPDDLNYLRLSYQLGMREGWIALKRNPLAFKVFQQLPPDLQENAVNEFIAMLRDIHPEFSEQAAEILIGPAWSERELILSHLAGLTDGERRRFAQALHSRGYDLNVPGIGLAPVDSHRFAPEIRVPQ